jgi:hypothetical protein
LVYRGAITQASAVSTATMVDPNALVSCQRRPRVPPPAPDADQGGEAGGLGLAIIYLPPPLRPDVLTPLAEALAEVN